MINNTEKLRVLQSAHQFVIKIYKLTKIFPKDERFRLTDQICRSASSIAANIAEGNCRQTKKEFVQFLFQSRGSLGETQYHLLLAKDLGIIDNQAYDSLIFESEDIGKMIFGLILYLKKQIKNRQSVIDNRLSTS